MVEEVRMVGFLLIYLFCCLLYGVQDWVAESVLAVLDGVNPDHLSPMEAHKAFLPAEGINDEGARVLNRSPELLQSGISYFYLRFPYPAPRVRCTSR